MNNNYFCEEGRQGKAGKTGMTGKTIKTGNTLKRLALIMLMIVGGVGTAGAQQYVFLYKNGNTYNFLYYNNGNVGNRTDFDASTCVFTSTGSTQYYIRSGNQNRYLRPRTGRNNYNLNFSTSTDYATWTPNGNKVVDYYGSYRLRYNNNSWSVSTTDSQNEVLFSYSTVSATAPSTPTITGNSTIAFSNSATYTASSSYTPEYSLFQNSTNTRYYYYNGNMSTTAPSSTSSGITYQWELSDGSLDDGHVRINSSTGLVEYYNTYSEENHNVTIRVTATGGGNSATNTKTIVCNDNRPISAPTGITATDKTIGMGSSWTIDNYTLTAASGTRPYNYITASSADVIIASVTNNAGTATITGLAIGTSVITIKAYGTDNSTEVCSTTFTLTVKEPETGVDGNIVTLNDYEDHNWTYYQSSGNLPTGYPTEYLSSPDPRNVKITYRAGSVSGATAVAISALDGEGQNEMVYYKTLEKTVLGMSGNYPYTVISNPFSKRPATGSGTSKVYYGFGGWKVISGGTYISEYNDGQTLPLDQTIHFTNLDNNYTPNCTSAEVVFEATWVTATVKTGSSAQSFTGGTYETNFWVLTGNPSGAVTVPANCTMTGYYPDGTASWTGNFTRAITAGGDNAKVEFVNMNSTGTVSAAGYTFTMGRGIENSGNGGEINGCTSNMACEHTVKIESGKYSSLYHFTASISSSNNIDQLMILGCDYDRARAVADNSYNNKLQITDNMYVAGTTLNLNRSSNQLYVRGIVKSGNLQSGVTIDNNYTGVGGSQTYYYSVGNSQTHNAGRRYLVVEGGILKGIAGGMDESNSQANTARAFDLRVRGTAQIKGVVYGAAQFAGGKGIRTMVFTGGTMDMWIAAGANGTNNDGGNINGNTYVYFGGTANQTSTSGIFGAAYGQYATGDDKYTVTKSHMVMADEATVAGSVYGGGNNGYATSDIKVFVTGGHAKGNVFGGANQARSGADISVIVTGGTVDGGVFGGSNQSGAVSGQITVDVYGTDPQPAIGYAIGEVYGGGNVAAYTGTPIVTVHCTDADTPISIRELYGGGKGSSATITGNTNVTVGGGNRIGYVYGGGNMASVTGKTSVNIKGGTIEHVFGGNNNSGTIYSNAAGGIKVRVNKIGTCPMKIGEIYGGGNLAPSQVGSIDIGCTGDYVSGNSGHAHCNETDNRIGYELEGIGDVYGGANAAAVTGNVNLTIDSGMVYRVFGNNNTSASVSGTITVNIDKKDDACGWYVGYVYGGGNQAPYTAPNATPNYPAVNVKNGMVSHNVFGGGLGGSATVTGNPQVILSGTAEVGGNVYGGGNAAPVSGNTKVTLRD